MLVIALTLCLIISFCILWANVELWAASTEEPIVIKLIIFIAILGIGALPWVLFYLEYGNLIRVGD